MLNENQILELKRAQEQGYPDTKSLLEGARFYPDEAFEDGYNRAGRGPWAKHPNANSCDCCNGPADYMTCPDGEDFELYICFTCVQNFGLADFVDDTI